MKHYILLLTVVCTLLSCKQEQNTTNIERLPIVTGHAPELEYIIFGSYAGECLQNCSAFYKLIPKTGELFLNTEDRYYPSNGAVFVFTKYVTNTTSIALATQVAKELPAVLLQTSADSVYGCPDCVDQGGMYLEFQQGSTKRKFSIDNSIRALPEEIKSYATNLRAVLDSLRDSVQ